MMKDIYWIKDTLIKTITIPCEILLQHVKSFADNLKKTFQNSTLFKNICLKIIALMKQIIIIIVLWSK